MSVQAWLEEQCVPVMTGGQHRHVRPGWIGVDCPWCGDSGKFHLGIREGWGTAVCWVCGPHRLGDALVKLTGQPLSSVLSLLKSTQTAPASRLTGVKPRGRLLTPAGLEPLRRPHRRYLRGRGLSPREVATLWGVRGISLSARHGWRLWIPVTLGGEVVSWTTRAIGDGPDVARYVSAGPEQEKVPHRSLLYGEDYAGHAIVIVEGPVDVWSLGPGAVSTFGLRYSDAQVIRMLRYPVRSVCFDAEPDAQKVARRLARDLSVCAGQTNVIELETGKDMAEADEEEVRSIRQRFLLMEEGP